MLQLLFAQVGERDRHFVPDVIAHGAGDHDLAGRCQLVDAGGDVDAVADQPIIVDDDVFHVDPDPEGQPDAARRLRSLLGHRALRIDRPGDGGNRAPELDENGVTGDLEHASAVLDQLRLDDIGAKRLPGTERMDVVLLHEP
jgi:hypothetical protein